MVLILSLQEIVKWVGIGKGLAGAAEELGVAANDFSKTPVGQWVAFLIIWHFMGSMVVHVVSGLLLVIVGIMGIRYFVKTSTSYEIIYSKEKTDLFGRAKIESTKYECLGSDASVGLMLSYFVLLITWSFTTFTGW